MWVVTTPLHIKKSRPRSEGGCGLTERAVVPCTRDLKLRGPFVLTVIISGDDRDYPLFAVEHDCQTASVSLFLRDLSARRASALCLGHSFSLFFVE
ncbi:hypothetical protein [Paracoccus sp. J56]|uniref:hypothetical protein n=1 Tax=Paracoccus sp. J56 TaxID=935850 RepID=UPI000A0CD53B|nr:hypothetical protein [Paracoccus sp. J56]SMG44180.1 hypothetical protein SAMN02746000_02671 [Paracoccus sp. J56]